MADNNEDKIDLNLNFEPIIPWNGQQDTGRDVRLKLDRNWQKVVDAFNILLEYIQTAEALEKKFLRKDQDDRTPFKLAIGDKLTAEKGIQIGSSFIPGILTGSGGFFDEYANGEVESLIIRRFLEVPELRYNRVKISLGDKWNAPGAGIIESVVPDYNADGSIGTTGTIFLKLEEGEYGAVSVGDICMGIFHSETSTDNSTEDYDDSRGNFLFAGFYTSYFTITEITGKNNGQFKYQIRPVSDRWKLTFHPNQAMHFVCYGSFTDNSRQTSVYTTRTYTRLLKNQNTWEISSGNIAMQWGDLTNMNVHGLDMTGYSVYLNNIYMTGVFKQVKPDGTPVQTVNDRGAWVSGTEYAFYDRVSHNGSLWLCVNESGTNSEPSKTNSDWLLQVASGDSLTAGGRFSSANTPYSPNSVVDFAEKAWVSTDTVDYAPYGIWTDASGNRFQFNDGGFCLVDEEMRDGWKVLLDTSGLKDGQDGKSFYVQFSTDGKNWHDTFTEGDIYMRQKVGEDATWSDAIRIVGEAGAAGVNGEYTEYEFAVNESLDTAPTSGWQDAPPTIGRGQYLWMRMRVVQGDGTVGNWSTPVRLKGEQGDNVEFVGHFATGSEIPFLGVVSMGNSNWVAKVKTINPPLWCWTDASGNRFTYSDGGFCLTGEENTEEYELMVSNGKDGADGTDYEFIFYNTTEEIRPSTPETKQVDDYIPSGWHDDAVGVSESVQYEWMSMRRKKDGLWGKYSTPALWAKFGEDGTNYEFVYTRTKTESRPTTPSTKQQDDYVPTGWTDDPVGVSDEYPYEWMSKRRKVGSVWGEFSTPAMWSSFSILSFKATAFIRTNDTPSTPTGGSYDSPIPTSTPKWYDGIPSGEEILWASTRVFTKNGTGIQESSWSTPRQMTDTSSFEVVYHASETEPTPPTNYPTTTGAWTPNNGWTDDPSESSVWMATATKSNGKWGAWQVSKIKGEKGTDGKDGKDYEFVYQRNIEYSPPSRPATSQEDDYIPTGWTDDPTGVTESIPYEWVCKRTKKDGVWSEFSFPALWAKYGEKGQKGDKGETGSTGGQGIQGCIIRDSEWAEGVEYRNDEDLTEGTRYIDVVLVRDENAATGWVAYKCIQTHTSTYRTKPYHSLYWEEFGTNTTAIFTSLIVAKNAKIKFLQGNQLLIQKNDGTVTGGLSGSEEGQKVRFWAGAETPDDAPFRVTEDGTMIAEDATIKGVIRNPWEQLVYKLIYSSSSGDAYGYDGSAIDNDKVSISPILRCELKIGWGDLADGRDVAIRVNNTSNSPIFIKVPTGYYAIDHEEKKVNAGSELILNVGYIYYLTGCSDCWVVNKRVKITG